FHGHPLASDRTYGKPQYRSSEQSATSFTVAAPGDWNLATHEFYRCDFDLPQTYNMFASLAALKPPSHSAECLLLVSFRSRCSLVVPPHQVSLQRRKEGRLLQRAEAGTREDSWAGVGGTVEKKKERGDN
ncbi:hypothetical protein BaRGS_00019267, partial [Batillaria attramentaria]